MSNMRALMEQVEQLCETSDYYSRFFSDERQSLIHSFMSDRQYGIRYNRDAIVKIKIEVKQTYADLKKDAEREAAESETPGNFTADIGDLLCEKITSALENIEMRNYTDNSRLDDLFSRKPDLEQSDELSFLQYEKALSRACIALDPTDQHFNLFIDALRTFYDYTHENVNMIYNHGLSDSLQETLAAALPLIALFYSVTSGRSPLLMPPAEPSSGL